MFFKKYFVLAAAAALSAMTVAQNLNSAYFTNDYKYRHSMNPAYGNEQNYISMPMLGNLNIGMRGNFGYEDIILDNPWYGVSGMAGNDKKLATFMHPALSASEALSGFNTGDNRLQGDIAITILSAGFKGFGGYNTFEINSKTSFGLALPYGLFEFAKNIGNKNYEIGDIDVNAMSYVELALGHSRQINEKLRVGAKLKFLVGAARADVMFENMRADMTGDKWTISGMAKANVSMKGFMFKSTESEYESRPGTYEHVDDVDVDGAGIGGFGMAVDLGGIYKINDDWQVSASVVDLGFINWSNDVMAVNSGEPFVFDGFHDVSVSGDRGEEIEAKVDKYADQLADFANLKDKGDQGSRSTGLGATVNLGCEYTLPVYKKLKFGALSSTRFRDNYTWTEGRVSANWEPVKWLDGGVNFSVNTFTTSLGWVINFHPKAYNFFIGMDHILGKTSKEFIPLNSNANIALGMNITW